MAATGATIVIIGLALLAIIISQLHKLIALISPKLRTPAPENSRPRADLAIAEADILKDMAAAARIYRPLTEDLGEKFKLGQLYQIFNQEQIAHPHLTIRSLRDAGYLLPADEDYFCWKTESQNL